METTFNIITREEFDTRNKQVEELQTEIGQVRHLLRWSTLTEKRNAEYKSKRDALEAKLDKILSEGVGHIFIDRRESGRTVVYPCGYYFHSIEVYPPRNDKFSKFSTPSPATINWGGIGAVSPELAFAYAEGINIAAKIAKELTYENCVRFNTTTPMYECPDFREQK